MLSKPFAKIDYFCQKYASYQPSRLFFLQVNNITKGQYSATVCFIFMKISDLQLKMYVFSYFYVS